MPKQTTIVNPDDLDQDETLLAEDDDLGFFSLDDAEETINVLFYGREGTGKTTDAAFMANVPGAKRVLIVNAEAGTKAVALRRRGVDTSKIVMWPPKGQTVTFSKLEALHQRILSDLKQDPTSWTGVVIDSATEIATALREQVTDDRHGKLDRAGRSYDEAEIPPEDYGAANGQLKKIFRRFRDLPCHFAVTALERVDSKNGGIGPDLTPGIATALLGYVDFVLYCRADQEAAGESDTEDEHQAEFRALTRASTKYRAKDRFDITPRVLVNPDFGRLAAYVAGDLTEDDDVLQQEYNERRAERARIAAEKKAEREAAKAAKKKTT